MSFLCQQRKVFHISFVYIRMLFEMFDKQVMEFVISYLLTPFSMLPKIMKNKYLVRAVIFYLLLGGPGPAHFLIREGDFNEP